MKLKKIKALVPGEETPVDVDDTTGIYTHRSYAYGVLTSIDSLYFFDTKTHRYIPSVDDIVIGKVFYRCSEYYKLDLKGFIGTLPSLSFKNATKRFKPELDVNDYVLSRVIESRSECLLSCMEHGLGRLEGYVMDVEPWKARKLYLSPFLENIGRKYRFSCALGLNGRVWIHSESLVVVRDVVNLIKAFK